MTLHGPLHYDTYAATNYQDLASSINSQKTRYYFKYVLRVLLVTLWFGVTRSDKNAVNDYITLSTITYFDWFPLHTQKESSFRVILTHGIYQNSLLVSTFLSNCAQWSQSATSDYTVHHNSRWTRCIFWLENGSLSFYRKYTLHLMITSTFAA